MIGAKIHLIGKNKMSKFESNVKQIAYPQQNVYNMLSDLTNIERVKAQIPDDKLKDLTFDKDTISICLLYTSPSPRDAHESRMPSSA